MTKKMDELTKAKLIYTIELIAFSLIAITLGILFLLGIIKVLDWKKWAFTIITLIGGCWAVIDFIWTIKSEKKRKKNSLLDKILLLPSALTLIVLDIICLINLIKDKDFTGFDNVNIFKYEIGIALIYVAIVFIIEAIYHWYHPLPLLLEEDKKEETEKENITNK